MEKHEKVFERFVDFENLYDGYRLASRNKRYKPEVLRYTANLEENLIDAQNHLLWDDYAITGVHEFIEYFPKKRIITVWPFENRVVNCAAYNVLWPIYERSMYEHSYGSIPNRGAIKACWQLQQWLRKIDASPLSKSATIGKIDIRRFFFRLPHEVQLRELGRPLNDPRMMRFLEICVEGDGRPTGLPLEVSDVTDCERIMGIGMPAGSLISQITGNVVLTPLDHYVKRVLRAPAYMRYMDDMIILGTSKQQVWDIIGGIDDYLRENLCLQLNSKTAVMRYNDGVEFVGRVVRPDRIDIRKSTALQMKRHLKYVREAYAAGEVTQEYARSVIASYLGLLKHTSSTAFTKKLCDDYVLVRKSI